MKWINFRIIVYTLFFFSIAPPHAFCELRKIALLPGHCLTRSDVETLRNSGVRILEPLPGGYHVCWMANRTAELPDFLNDQGPLELSNRIDTNLLSHHLPSSDRIACWFFEVGEPDAGLEWITDIGGSIIHSSSIQMASGVFYRIYGFRVTNLDMQNALNQDRLRYIYREPEHPIVDDEMAALQVLINLSDPESDHSVFEETRRLRIDGGRSRTGIIDTGLSTNETNTCHPDLRGRLTHYFRYPGSPGFDYVGHGTHIAGIIAGNGALGDIDTHGFRLGLGLALTNRLAISDALLAAPFPPSVGFAGIIRDIALSGARICNNSWTDGQGTGVGYHPNCAIWDAAVREADPSHEFSSSWPMTIVFSAGNEGPGLQTITCPKEAKNIITVGAAGSLRSGNANSISSSSSRGPCMDGRLAPTLCAPGESVFSAWPVDSYYSVSGTSSAAAHVTGAATLIAEWWYDRMLNMPSPALMKGILILSAIPLGDSIPDPAQGWGRLVIAEYQPIFPAACVQDQTTILTATQPDWTATLIPESGQAIIDIVLTWSDPPAAPGASPALINDLDLSVRIGETIFRGNNFDGLISISGGSSDRLNNVERVRISNTNELLFLNVSGHSIRGDGVPSNPDPSDQDFAIAVKGAYLVSDRCVLQTSKTNASCTDTVSVLALSHTDRNSTSLSLEIASQMTGQSIETDLRSEPPGSGVFVGEFLVGDRSRPHEISTAEMDQISLTLLGVEETTVKWLQVDCRPPQFDLIEFMKIDTDKTDIRVGCSELCTLTLSFHAEGSDQWFCQTSDLWAADHLFHVQDLSSGTQYHGHFSIVDRAGNTAISSDQFEELRWSTAKTTSVYVQNFDADPQFTQMDGLWEWGQPQGSGSPPDPVSGYTGENVLGYNLNGNYQNRLTGQFAISPLIDCSEPGNYYLSFFRWLGTENGVFDEALVSVRNQQMQWIDVWKNPYYEIRDTQWLPMRLDITSHANGNDQFQFRFQQGPTDSGITRCGWNIDDIRIDRNAPCEATPTPAFAKTTPAISLQIDGSVYFPGDLFSLICWITSAGAVSDMALAVRITVYGTTGETSFYFPNWQSVPDWEPVPVPSLGRWPIQIAQFTVPHDLDLEIRATIEAWLIDVQYSSLIASSGISTVTFCPSRDAVNKIID